ncbi:thioredoxin [bacterium]|nr:thioredoxin [bacterium]
MKTKIEADDNNFNEMVIDRSKKTPVVVDFWATWCMPCLILDPVLGKLAEDYKGKFILAKKNTEKNPVTSQKYGIMSIPYVKLFKNGRVVDELIGALPESAIKQWLDRNLEKDTAYAEG